MNEKSYLPTHEDPGEASKRQSHAEHEEDDEEGQGPADQIIVNLQPGLLSGDQHRDQPHDEGHQGRGHDHDLPPPELVEKDRAEASSQAAHKGRDNGHGVGTAEV